MPPTAPWTCSKRRRGLAREIGDAMGVGFALCQQASLRAQQRNYREALRLLDPARPWSERARAHQDLDELHAHRSWLLGQLSVTESRRKDGHRRRHPQKQRRGVEQPAGATWHSSISNRTRAGAAGPDDVEPA
jgi:hypothetical protein